MAYSDFLENISVKFHSLLNEISAEYNFDNGHEFEIAICKVLRVILPQKYGICRGFAVSQDGEINGDDIIIFDHDRFPTLRLLEDKTFAQKQKIPIEAVYAYIEAKHTLCIEGSGGQSLSKAISQIKAIKEMNREKVPLTQITPQINIGNFKTNRQEYWPQYFNPIYGVIISRYLRINETQKPVPVKDFFPHLQLRCATISIMKNSPDLIIAGSDALILPAVGTQIESPFFINGTSRLESFESDGKAFGTGLMSMMYALDNIILGKIHWPTILAEGLNLNLNMGAKE
ncbi:DUF6602 domain-containing protein [Flavobacterium buctense]|uniref:DUF6602 domain-containing protein n=1 Tax=Flavobacterium buctense TaxID=1648146 RepID=A0ABU9E1Y4_9FLAO|nr:DUF6602 domain-containing protein [Flavobacterium buctense]